MSEYFFQIKWEELLSAGLSPRNKNPKVENYLKEVIKLRLLDEDIRRPFKLLRIQYLVTSDMYNVVVEVPDVEQMEIRL